MALDGIVVATTPTVTIPLSGGVHSLTFAASDGTQTASDSFTVTVIQPAVGPAGPRGLPGLKVLRDYQDLLVLKALQGHRGLRGRRALPVK